MNLAEVAKNSLINCHAMGLDSVVFTPDVRMFVARPSHELWRNAAGHKFSIGMHPHHRDITIVPIHGRLSNVEFANGRLPEFRDDFYLYQYESAIRDGVGKLSRRHGKYDLGLVTKRVITPRFMPATEMHTVHVPKGETAAWYIFSGKENPNYRGVLYSNRRCLDLTDFSDMYEPMSEKWLEKLLKITFQTEVL